MDDLTTSILADMPPLDHELLAPVAKLDMCHGIGDGVDCGCVMHFAFICWARKAGQAIEGPSTVIPGGCPVLRSLAVALNDLSFWRDSDQRKAHLLPLIAPLVKDRPADGSHTSLRRAMRCFIDGLDVASDALRECGKPGLADRLDWIPRCDDFATLATPTHEATAEVKAVMLHATLASPAAGVLDSVYNAGEWIAMGYGKGRTVADRLDHSADCVAKAAWKASRIRGMRVKPVEAGDERSIQFARRLIALFHECIAIV